jgi:23S rRNA pseudouridine1911/1915/1917 synthase
MPEILYEDNHIIIINKRSGDITQGDKTGDDPVGESVKSYIKEKYNKPGNVFLGVAHRLDRPVSGILVLARTSKALERLAKMFREKEIQKTYWAIVERAPEIEQGTLTDYIAKNQEKNKSRLVAANHKEAKLASLSYRTLTKSEKYTLLEVDLHTGRHHQIRVQLSNMGCVIKGDLKYGAKRSNNDGSISLHARSIKFEHPVSKEAIHVVAPCPKNDALWNFFESEVK